MGFGDIIGQQSRSYRINRRRGMTDVSIHSCRDIEWLAQCIVCRQVPLLLVHEKSSILSSM